MKVLSTLNDHFGEILFRAFVIWFTTAIIGTLSVSIVYSLHLLLHPVAILLLSLCFSSPAIILALPVLYSMTIIRSTLLKAGIAISSILAVSGVVIGIVSIYFNESYLTAGEMMFPFIPSAIVCFFLFGWKQIKLSPLPAEANKNKQQL